MKIVLTALFSLALLAGCRADDEVKQGVQGEFCDDSDADCRLGYMCDRGYCRLQSVEGTDCRAMCARIAGCGIEDESCVSDCQATVAGDCGSSLPCPWSDNAVNAFGACIVNDLSCEQIAGGDGPQLCYDQLSLAADRKAVCDRLISFMDACGANSTDGLLNRCYQLGRTATDDSFARTNTCDEAAADGACVEGAECVNAIFVLSPAIVLTTDAPN